jgi:hypothetical protein
VKLRVKQNYAELRRDEYPDIREQLDALWKGDVALEEMRQRIMDVKARYPKELKKDA